METLNNIDMCISCNEQLEDSESLCASCFEVLPMDQWITVETLGGK